MPIPLLPEVARPVLRARHKIVVAEDDDAMRTMLVEAISGDGHEVLEAADGAAARELLAARPSLVLCDVRMPGRDGLWLVRAVREVAPEVPVLLLTAFPDEALLDRARELGAVGVFAKPVDLDDVRTAVTLLARAADAEE
jgi:CheY-like chemotaxis protein